MCVCVCDSNAPISPPGDRLGTLGKLFYEGWIESVKESQKSFLSIPSMGALAWGDQSPREFSIVCCNVLRRVPKSIGLPTCLKKEGSAFVQSSGLQGFERRATLPPLIWMSHPVIDVKKK